MTNSPIDFSKLQPVTLIGGGFLRGAHHPHCERYFNHLLWYRGRPFCLGCTCMYTGIVLGFPTALIFQDTYSTLVAWLTLHLLLVAPTIAQPFVQLKCYKIVARLLLGVCITTYFLSGLFFVVPPIPEWLFRVALVPIFMAVYYTLRHMRNRCTYDPCSDCPLGTFPTCDWNLPRLLRENPDVQLLQTIGEQLERQ